MSNWLGFKQHLPIGLDIGSRCIKAVQLAGRPGRRAIIAAAAIPRRNSGPLEIEELTALRQTLGRQGFIGVETVIAAPEKQLISSLLELPPRESGAPIERIARMELASVHKIEAGDMEAACWELPHQGRTRDASKVMAVGLKHADAHSLLGAFSQSGLDLTAIDIHAAAAARACAAIENVSGQVTALLNLGWETSMLVVLDGDVVVYERRISGVGIKALCDQINARLGLDAQTIECLIGEVGLKLDEKTDAHLEVLRQVIEEHMAGCVRQLNVSFTYISHQYPDSQLSRLLVFGGGGGIPGLCDFLRNQTGIESAVFTLDQWAGAWSHAVARQMGPLLINAIGLSLHAEAPA